MANLIHNKLPKFVIIPSKLKPFMPIVYFGIGFFIFSKLIGDKKLPTVVGVYELNNYEKRFLGNLVDGKKHGTWKEFHPNKRVLVENYKNGNLDGAVSLFYTNGQKEWRYNYSNGILNGSYSRWYSNGIKATNGYFENGEPVGLWAWWDKNGVITKKTIIRKQQVKTQKSNINKSKI